MDALLFLLFKLPATQGEFFFSKPDINNRQKIGLGKHEDEMLYTLEKVFFGERMSSIHLYNIVTKCCCSRLLSNKEFCTIFPVEEMPVYAP